MGAGMRQGEGFFMKIFISCTAMKVLHILQSNQGDQAFSKTNFLSLHIVPERRIDVHVLST